MITEADRQRIAAQPQIYDACAKAVAHNDTVPPGEMREVVRINPENGFKEIRFYGQRSFVADLGRPGRRVVKFRTSDGAPGWW
jgi:hypothetical protein